MLDFDPDTEGQTGQVPLDGSSVTSLCLVDKNSHTDILQKKVKIWDYNAPNT